MAKPSVNRGKITSTNSTHPTSKTAKQIPVQRNACHTEPLSLSDLVPEPVLPNAAQRINWCEADVGRGKIGAVF
ncbi:hypothetical protein [Leisingera sp. NJS204]|uniref:hypothetical protein n=1 Tax=Leisingera sp. NJS204 TaxID=2508307 RepID=UPI001010ACEC|nr:hypothetical protein [Leisingera sp. NJS204]QAX28788.1 hypothetical protein ETW24_05100 [Leisingera sp. NJS204]